MKRLLIVMALTAFTLPSFAQKVVVADSTYQRAISALNDCPNWQAEPAREWRHYHGCTREYAQPIVISHQAPAPVVQVDAKKHYRHGTNWSHVFIGAVAGAALGTALAILLDDDDSPGSYHVIDHRVYVICTEGILALTGMAMCGGD